MSKTEGIKRVNTLKPISKVEVSKKEEGIKSSYHPPTTIPNNRRKVLRLIATFLQGLDHPTPLRVLNTFISPLNDEKKMGIIYFLLKHPVGYFGSFKQILRGTNIGSISWAVKTLRRNDIIRESKNREAIIKLKDFYLNRTHIFRMDITHFHNSIFFEITPWSKERYKGIILIIRKDLPEDIAKRIDDYPISIAQEISVRRNFPESERIDRRIDNHGSTTKI